MNGMNSVYYTLTTQVTLALFGRGNDAMALSFTSPRLMNSDSAKAMIPPMLLTTSVHLTDRRLRDQIVRRRPYRGEPHQQEEKTSFRPRTID